MLVSPVHSYHVDAGANFFEWAGWKLPAFYTSPADELCRVRTLAGYTEFPVLNQFVIRGPGAFKTLQKLCSRNLDNCPPGKAVYTLMLDEAGAIADDGILFRLADDRFIISVACKNPLLLPRPLNFTELKEPKEWLRPASEAHACIHFLGSFLISVQGPRSKELLRPVANLDDLTPFSVRETRIADIPVIVARTGYSGEVGFEFLVWPEHAPALWELIVQLGKPHGACPYGIQTTLIIGLEKGYLNSLDCYPGSTPLELGLAWAVDLEKPDFVGKTAILKRREEGIKTRLVGLELAFDAPTPTSGDQVVVGDHVFGRVTNAAASPHLRRTLARAWLPLDKAVPDSEVEVLTGKVLSRARISRRYCWYDPEGIRVRA